MYNCSRWFCVWSFNIKYDVLFINHQPLLQDFDVRSCLVSVTWWPATAKEWASKMHLVPGLPKPSLSSTTSTSTPKPSATIVLLLSMRRQEKRHRTRRLATLSSIVFLSSCTAYVSHTLSLCVLLLKTAWAPCPQAFVTVQYETCSALIKKSENYGGPKKCTITVYLPPITCCLLPSTYYLLPTAYYLLSST